MEVTVRTTSIPFDSDALRANIASTAQKVVIPDRYLPLVEAVEGFYGVRASSPRRSASTSTRTATRTC